MNNKIDSNFVNFLRGFAIFLMLWGHSIQYSCGNQFDFFENWAFKVIYTFHMPLFMIISGYLFFFSEEKRDFKELVIYKTKSLLYPILMCGIINRILTTGMMSLIFGVWSDIFGPPSLESLWFLWSVLAASFAVSIAVKFTDNSVIQAILLVAGIAIVSLFPCREAENIYMYPYFVAGYIYARNRNKIKHTYYNLTGVLSVIIFLIMLFSYKKVHYIYTSGIFGGATIFESAKIDFFRWGIGLFGSIAVIWICEYIVNLKINCKICGWFQFVGKNSLAFYALSVALLSFYLPLITKRTLSLIPLIDWNKNIAVYNLLITPLIAVGYTVLISLIVKILKKINIYTIIFGR